MSDRERVHEELVDLDGDDAELRLVGSHAVDVIECYPFGLGVRVIVSDRLSHDVRECLRVRLTVAVDVNYQFTISDREHFPDDASHRIGGERALFVANRHVDALEFTGAVDNAVSYYVAEFNTVVDSNDIRLAQCGGYGALARRI